MNELKLKHIFLLIINFIVVISIIGVQIRRYNEGFGVLLFFTMWGFYLNSVEFVMNFICDFNKYILNSNKFDWISDFSRNKYSHIVNPFSYLILTYFWGFGIFRLEALEKSFIKLGVPVNIYLHIINAVHQINH